MTAADIMMACRELARLHSVAESDLPHAQEALLDQFRVMLKFNRMDFAEFRWLQERVKDIPQRRGLDRGTKATGERSDRAPDYGKRQQTFADFRGKWL